MRILAGLWDCWLALSKVTRGPLTSSGRISGSTDA